MISRNELGEYRTVTGFSQLGHLEKDYLQHVILIILSDGPLGSDLIFKGGTCLQKAYGLPRFSEDLDFDLAGAPEAGAAVDALHKTAKQVGTFGYESEFAADKKTFPGSSNGKFRVRGPLYDGSPVSVSSVQVDVRFEKPLLPAVLKTINPPYADLRPYSVQTLDLNEVLAEKVRAVMTRSEPRDLYDLWFVTGKYGLTPDYSLIDRKLALYELHYSKKEFLSSARVFKKNFSAELSRLVRKELIPSYDDVERRVREAFD